MKTIKYLFMLLAVAIGFTACQDEFKDGKYNKAPENLPYGVYSLSQSDTGFNYYLIHTKSAIEGDEALVVLRENLNPEIDETTGLPDYAWRTVVAATTTDGYNNQAGVLACTAESCYYGDGLNGTQELEAEVSLIAPTPYTTGYQYQIIVDGEAIAAGNATYLPNALLPVIYPYGESAYDEDHPELYKYLEFDTDGTGLGFFSFDDLNNRNVVDFTYTFDAATGTGSITTADGAVYTISLNEFYQLVITDADGNEIPLDAYTSDSEPEPFTEVSDVNITFDAFNSTSTPWESKLYQSDLDPSKFKIDPLFIDTYTAIFYETSAGYVLDPDSRIALPLYHSTYGTYYIRSSAYGTFSGGVYDFPCQLYVSAGTFSGTYYLDVDTNVNGTSAIRPPFVPKNSRIVGEREYLLSESFERAQLER